jgi:hypothetical protein
MVLDMESEFYKLARDILSKPKNLYKVVAIGPRSGRVTIMGADGFVVVGSAMLRSISKGPEGKAYKLGKATGKEMFGNLLKEFDEEIMDLPPKKLLELGLLLASGTGWGDLEATSVNDKAGEAEVRAKRTLELKYSKAKHNMLTCGFLTSIASLSLRKDLQGVVSSIDDDSVIFKFS